MGKIKVGSTVVLNKNIYDYCGTNLSLRGDIKSMYLRWRYEGVVFTVLGLRDEYCDIEGFAIPINCLDLTDIQK